MPTKIKISWKLIARTISLLESLDLEDFTPETIQLYGYVLYAFKNKSAQFDDSQSF
jgi:hypothetical protein